MPSFRKVPVVLLAIVALAATLSLSTRGNAIPAAHFASARTGYFSPPTTTASLSGSQGGNGTYTGAVTVTLSATDPNGPGVQATYYAVDGGSQQTYSSSFAVSGNGGHSLAYWSVDYFGDTEATNTLTFAIDTSAPTTTASLSGSLAGNGKYTGPVQVTLSATDPDGPADVAATYYAVDGASQQTYSGTFAVAGNGSHTLSFWSVDQAGNTEAANTQTLAIDTSAPTTTASPAGTAGSNGWYTGPVQVTLSATDPDGPADVAATYYTLDGASQQTYSGTFAVAGDGGHTLTFWSVDQAGNTEAVNTLSIKIDGTPPTLTWGSPSPAPNAAGWNNSAVSLTYSATDATSGLASATPPSALSFSSQGAAQTQSVTLTDVAGNSATLSSPAVSIDLSAPSTTASVSGTQGSGGTYQGSATVTLGSSDNLSGVASTFYTLDGGSQQSYSGPVTLSAPGSHTLTYWSVDVAGNVETAHTLNLSIASLGSVRLALSSFANPSVYGQSVTLKTVVTPSSSGATPTGTVTYLDGSTTLGTATLNSSGAAYLSITTLAVGVHSITASYGGDSNYSTATSSVLSQTVGTAAPYLSVSATPNPSAFGQSVTFRAAVGARFSGSALPTGSITFQDGSKTLGTASVNSGGVAYLTTSTLAMGSHSITAIYNGDGNYSTATSSALTQTVGLSNTYMSLSSWPNPAVFGQSLTFKAGVAGRYAGVAAPTGTITFQDGGTTLGTASVNSSGNAYLTITTLPVGSHPITAVYNGDSNYTTNTIGGLTETVNAAPSYMTLSATPASSSFGQSVTFRAAVATRYSGSTAPTGTVTFKDGSVTLGTITLSSSGVAYFTSTTLSVGSHSVTAVYNGDSNYATNTSPAVTETISQSTPLMALSSFANPAVFGQSVTLKAALSNRYGGGTTPTGTVVYMDGSATLGTATVGSNGAAYFTTSSLSVGSHAISVSYGGDSNYASTSAGGLTQTVNRANSTVTLTASPNPSAPNMNVTFTATAAPAAPTPTKPTGTVTFQNGSTVLGTATLNSSGVASLTVPPFALGTYSITATYSSDTNFNGSTSAILTQTVVTTLVMPVGDSITLGATPGVAGSHGGYRIPLWQQTTNQGWSLQYVGSVFDPAYIGGCEGHSGTSISDINQMVTPMLPKYQPTIILLEIGNNDFGRYNESASTALGYLDTLLNSFASASPGTTIYVASLTPVDPTKFSPNNSQVASINSYNQGLPGLVQQHANSGQLVQFVDMHSLCGFTTGDWTADGVHPTSSGYAKMATVWYNVLSGVPH